MVALRQRARGVGLPTYPEVATTGAFPPAFALLLALACEFDCTRQFSVPFRFPLAFAYAASLQATAQAFAVAFQVAPIEVEVALLAGQCDVNVLNAVVVVASVHPPDGRPIPSKAPKVALCFAF